MIFGLQFIDTTKVGGMSILSPLTHNEVLLIQNQYHNITIMGKPNFNCHNCDGKK
jgi:hypothetical protein